MHKKDDKWQRPKNIFYKGCDKSKWCNFHRDYGNITDDCKDVKYGIKDLVRRGYFKHYQAQTNQDRPLIEEDDTRRSVKERITKIHVISGGAIHGGSIHVRGQSQSERGKASG